MRLTASLARRALVASAASLIGLAAITGLPARAAAPAPAQRGELFYVGMQGDELRGVRLDPASGALSAVGTVDKVNRPFWMVRHPTLPILYTGADNGSGVVIAYRIDRATGALTRIGQAETGGGGTTNLWLDPVSRTLLAANYGGGSVASIRVKADGSLGERLSLVKNTGSGPTPRQASPHAHGVILAPGGRFALVSDLGADRVFVYPFDRKTGRLSEPAAGAAAHYVGAAGSGPRHLEASPNGRFVYLVNELTADIVAFAWNGVTGKLTPIEKVSTDAAGFTGVRSAAEIRFGPGGRFLYVANRSDGAMLVYRADPRTGKLTLLQRLSAEGPTPWAFDFDPTGRWLVVAQQGPEKLVVFKVDPRSGLLSPTGKSLPSPKPVAVTFVR
ncbi:lactonase family protein [Novosphingobium flavum]|uniref:Lactonase family protein n=1 Tax=Novosphingobium flavum TaxID=1778672 RepID=A0A7X1FS61_9SPHN|nr:lactonase family protein [Novosphingobium flavum]MBC2665980.1 lactonase family protein [Novosphingobium flavum]